MCAIFVLKTVPVRLCIFFFCTVLNFIGCLGRILCNDGPGLQSLETFNVCNILLDCMLLIVCKGSISCFTVSFPHLSFHKLKDGIRNSKRMQKSYMLRVVNVVAKMIQV